MSTAAGDGTQVDTPVTELLLDPDITLDIRATPFPRVVVVSSPLWRPTATVTRIPEGLGVEQWLEGGCGSTHDSDIDLQDRPQVDKNGFAEGIDGGGVKDDGVQSDDGDDGGKGTDAEDSDEGVLFFSWAVDTNQRLDGECEDENVGKDIEARCEVKKSGSVNARPWR
jgi:hypothetical protein